MSKWIPVTERLPDRNIEVLVFGFGVVKIGWYDTNVLQWYSDFIRYDEGEVTHWMPLPKPPENGVTDTNVGDKSSWVFASLDEIIDCYSEPPERSDTE